MAIPARWASLRNVHRTTPWNLSTRVIEQEIRNLRELALLGHGTRGDANRILDLEDELARRDAADAAAQESLKAAAARAVDEA